ncbi:hypothetical protein ABT189_04935 [Streptomyces sp900105755]|uniref:hypothetical protein n=1 Tax=Streptomyces sp. 900105755 TaxID=3154389 RepID=UPI003328D4E7
MACVDARLSVHAIQKDTGIRPSRAVEAFADLDTEVRQSIAAITAGSVAGSEGGAASRHTTLTGCRTTASNR